MAGPFEAGLVDRIDVFSAERSDSGFGTIVANEILLAENLKCRFTTKEQREIPEEEGHNSRIEEKVIVQDTDVFQPKKKLYKIKQDGIRYLVLKHKRQRDEYGCWHHVSLTVEREDDTPVV